MSCLNTRSQRGSSTVTQPRAMSYFKSARVPPSARNSAAVVAAMYFLKRSPAAPRFGFFCATAMGAARATRLFASSPVADALFFAVGQVFVFEYAYRAWRRLRRKRRCMY